MKSVSLKFYSYLLITLLISGFLSAQAAADFDDGWVYEDGWTGYCADGQLLSGCIQIIDGDWYCFQDDGRLLEEGETCSVIDENGTMIRVRSGWDNILLSDEWYEDPDNPELRYYYGDDCAAACGPTQIRDLYFLFDTQTGELLYNQEILIDGVRWKSDAYGILSEDEFVSDDPQDGWITREDGGTGYVRDGETVMGEILEIDGLCYYFDDSGLLLVGDSAAAFNSIDALNRRIRADENGVLYQNAFFTDPESGEEYYYCGNCLSAYGFLEMEDGLRFFYENGRMAKGETLFINNQWIRFDDNGCVIPDTAAEEGDAPADGWLTVDGEQYYYRSGEPISAGRHIVDWKEYIFGAGGRLLHDCVEGDYLLNSEGLVVQEGPYRLGEFLYYVNPETHQILRNARVSIDNIPYIADSDGHLMKIDSASAAVEPEERKTETAVPDEREAEDDEDAGYVPVNEPASDMNPDEGSIWYSDNFSSEGETDLPDASDSPSEEYAGSDNPESGMLVWRGGEWTEVHGSPENPIEIRIFSARGAIMDNEIPLRDAIICSPEGIIGYDQ